ncbi:P-loop NTPase family protein [Adhaeribacter soli]|uniref:Uncharacterized protein n=1 Tax=Adhaeribacter soli TaxID=2607655 RepID=A0A5N1J0S7_9BACT|nr:hypothetical protein [Adhaeribacter soli]KAA9340141.1 hypothetical protein F0P94_07270 [Adhaeribacter soli]
MLQLKEILTNTNPSTISRSVTTPGGNFNPLARFTAEQLLNVVICFHEYLARQESFKTWLPTLFIDENNLEPLLKICASFAQDKKALLQFKMRINRGLIISGAPSQGKTHILRLFQRLIGYYSQGESFGLVNAQKVVREFEQNGATVVDRYSNKRNMKCELIDYAYDDILAERPARHYGGPETLVMPEIIEIRESVMNNHGIKTYFTTNHRSAVIKDIYGDRTIERILAMCDPVVFPPEAGKFRHNSMS